MGNDSYYGGIQLFKDEDSKNERDQKATEEILGRGCHGDFGAASPTTQMLL
jgi:hypothetical protein